LIPFLDTQTIADHYSMNKKKASHDLQLANN